MDYINEQQHMYTYKIQLMMSAAINGVFLPGSHPAVADVLNTRFEIQKTFDLRDEHADLKLLNEALQIPVNSETYVKELHKQIAKIVISDTNQTTYLQSIALDIPTIIFWDPLSTEINIDAKNLIDKLNYVGILHYSPESAADFLNKNYENIYKWWMSAEVRDARASFISKYAKFSNNWENDWIQFIKKYLVE